LAEVEAPPCRQQAGILGGSSISSQLPSKGPWASKDAPDSPYIINLNGLIVTETTLPRNSVSLPTY
jgi:hypothetical protein